MSRPKIPISVRHRRRARGMQNDGSRFSVVPLQRQQYYLTQYLGAGAAFPASQFADLLPSSTNSQGVWDVRDWKEGKKGGRRVDPLCKLPRKGPLKPSIQVAVATHVWPINPPNTLKVPPHPPLRPGE